MIPSIVPGVTPDLVAALTRNAPDPRCLTVLDQLLSGQSAAINVMSDSTGVYAPATEDKRTFGRLAEQIAAYLGTAVRVEFYQFDSSASNLALHNWLWAPTNVMQAGAGERGVTFDGSTGGRSRQIRSDALPMTAVSADFGCRARFKPATLSQSTTVTIGQKGATGNRGIGLNMGTDASLSFQWFPDKTNDATGVTFALTAAQAALTTADVQDFRFEVQANNGAATPAYVATAYKSADGGKTWTQVAQVTGSATTSLDRTGTAPWELGGRGSTGIFNGTIYQFQVFDGIGQQRAPMLPISVDMWQSPSPTASGTVAAFVGSPTLYFMNGAVAGKDLHYMLGLVAGDYLTAAPLAADGTNKANKLIYPSTPGVTFLNDGHNEATATGAAWIAALNLYKSTVSARNPDTILGYTVQNPEKIGTAAAGTGLFSQQSADHHINRQRKGQQWAYNNGLVVVDLMSEILKDAAGLDNIAADGVHPNFPSGNGITNGKENGTPNNGYIVTSRAFCRKFGVPPATA